MRVFLRALWLFAKAMIMANKTGNAQYFAMTDRGIPFLAVYVATGREAWRISQMAAEGWEEIKPK